MKKMKAKKGEKQCLTILNCCKSSFLSFDILKFYNIFAIALHWKTSVLLCNHRTWFAAESDPVQGADEGRGPFLTDAHR